MGKPEPRPMGLKKYKSTVKKQFLRSLQGYAKQLEAELQAAYSNPDTMVGKFAAAYQQSQVSNKRLSVLCATLIKQHPGERVILSKADMDSFKGKVINIKWELPEGTEKPEEAKGYVFTYDAITEEEFARMQQAAAAGPGPPAPAPPQGDQVPESPPVTATEAAIPPGIPAIPTPVPLGPAGYDPAQEKIPPGTGTVPGTEGIQENAPAAPEAT